MNFIINNEAYKELPFKLNKNGIPAITPKTTPIGKARIEWVYKKAKQLNISTNESFYSKVVFQLHPTKERPCQICGNYMSIYYIYPSKKFVYKINKTFSSDFTFLDSLFDIIDNLKEYQVDENDIKKFLQKEFQILNMSLDLNDLINECEKKCRYGESSKLGPGAMSNFPDRFDGFHSYNRCCRELEDKGRHRDNMNTYNKDRRAYEYWSDGNIKAANSFMHSSFFKDTSADHIGPISLGFKHESFLLKRMHGSDNSAKRDRLFVEDVNKLIAIENNNDYCAISRQSTLLWNTIKNNFNNSQNYLDIYQMALKQSTNNYLNILWHISNFDKGKEFLINKIIKPKFKDFEYTYKFDDNGFIIDKQPRHITDATKKEWDRLIRIHFESLQDYHSKNNRNIKFDIGEEGAKILSILEKEIKEDCDSSINTFNLLLLKQQEFILKSIK